MKFALLPFLAVSAVALDLRGDQNPCAGCNNDLAEAYQKCAHEYGNGCDELNSKGLVIKGAGKKKDVRCCMKKEKHDRCLECTTMDCAFKTCNVNKKYYSKYSDIMDAKTKTKEAYKKHDAAAMKKSGWGL